MNREVDLGLQSLLMWAVEHRDEINFRYGMETLDKLKVVTVYMTYNNRDFFGSAVGLHTKNTIGRAIAECVERIVVGLNRWGSSNGAAVHFDPSIAAENAYRELIERDAFIYYFQWGFKPSYIGQSENVKDVNLFSLRSVDPELVITLAWRKENYVLGLGCTESIEQSIKRAEGEVVAMKTTMEIHKTTEIDFSTFKNLKRTEPIDHQKLALNLEYQKLINNWPLEGKTFRDDRNINPKEKLKVSFIKPPAPYDSTGLVVAHAVNPQLLNYYLGMPESESGIRQEALALGEKSSGPILKIPHPFS